ncbi:MAG: class II aldolase/adducin family protein, partial [Kamptonema sp. SIO4C4]|nr:class II aldolase/adducin family protein [Kamptonema sp. SIO4C4]
MIDEGYIKYHCDWQLGDPVAWDKIAAMNECRDRLFQLNLIGQYPNGIGFGNISCRDPDNPNVLIVSGTQTGHLPTLTEQHYTRVTDYNLAENNLTCVGPIKASSESLTHATLYNVSEEIQAIIHVHHWPLWEKLCYTVPTTAKDCAYGTPEMAEEMMRLFAESDLPEKRILAMSGHEEGVITF